MSRLDVSCVVIVAVFAMGLTGPGLLAGPVTTNVVSGSHSAWCENLGWMNWRGQGTGDASTPPPRIEPRFCAGFVWCENVGWLNLGDGSPTSGTAYSQGAGDTGVNVSPAGDLSGYAWGENIGWVNFGWAAAGDSNRPRVNVSTGRFSGFAWGENVGWINLDGSATGGSAARLRTQPTSDEMADGIIGKRPLPLGSDTNEDGINGDVADVVTLLNSP